MNRAQRRAAERRKNRPAIPGQVFIGDPDIIARLDPHCPDCASELEYWTDNDGIPRVDVMHDDTCLTWRAMQRRANPNA